MHAADPHHRDPATKRSAGEPLGELALLDKRLARVTESGAGTAVTIRGRRQVGKSRLVQEFCDRADTP
jgi:hypothetical protein